MRYQKGKLNVIKGQKKIIFKSVGFADFFLDLKDIKSEKNSCQNRSKNNLVRENAVTRAHGSFSLRVMGSWCKLIQHRPQSHTQNKKTPSLDTIQVELT